MYYLLSLFLIGVGILMICSPGTWFAITESWKSDSSGEPSRLFLISTRFGGVMCTLVGVAFLFVKRFL